MTKESPSGSWFLKDPDVPGQERAIERICARTAGTPVHVTGLPFGGAQVWLDCAAHRWRLHHRMARELRLAGWHTETGADRLLVLGWSASFLRHRVRMLSAALSGRLADFDRTAFTAVMIATRLRHDGFPAAELPGEVRARCAAALRWPDRLADLRGLERTSTLEPLRLRLAQVAGLEAKVGRRCAEHLALAAKVARAVAGGAPPGLGLVPQPRAPGPRAGLTERMVCVCVPNRPCATATAGTSP
ncbi:hypothetical protein [Nonomuraea pusilla]|uniref:Uncharacterized protein n=1 Tax=Nonomuraea pusilla TaxID=46177 RepID=A0A1H7M410_9ACTN|nr:hypothetical protein [Nonomuraea pusilla]SEL05943.1 hypothetical protein SAMN05660976_01756 [Nonomuraea pusilla]